MFKRLLQMINVLFSNNDAHVALTLLRFNKPQIDESDLGNSKAN